MMEQKLQLFQWWSTTNCKRYLQHNFPSDKPWSRRWGGIDRYTAQRFGNGQDSQLSVFTNGWLRGKITFDGQYELDDFGRYQVQMNGKGAIVKMLQRRYNYFQRIHSISR